MSRDLPRLHHRVGLVWVALLFSLAACGANAAPPPSVATPSAKVAATTPMATPAPPASPSPSAAPLGDHVVAQWTVASPSFIAFGFGSVWVPNHYGNKITRIDPATNQVLAVIDGTGNSPEDALVVGNRLWVTGQDDDTTVIDPATNTVTATIKGHLLFMDYGFDSVWITTRYNEVERFDPVTATLTATIPVGENSDNCMNDVVTTARAVWVISCDTGELIKIDPATERVVSRIGYAKLIQEAMAHKTVPAGKGTDSIWITAYGDEGDGGFPAGLLRINPATAKGVAFLPLAPAHIGDGFNAITAAKVWLGGSEEINRVDVATNTVDATYPTAPGRLKIGVGFGSVWLRNFEQDLIQRLDYAP